MTGLAIGMAIGFIVSTACYVIYILINKPFNCDGEIVMHGDELYLAITEEDKEAFEKHRYATLKLVREKFSGFSE